MCNNQNIQSYPQVNTYAQAAAATPYSVPQTAAQYDVNGSMVTVSPRDNMLPVQQSELGTPMVNISNQSELPETLTHYEYIPGYLRAHLGALMRVEFLVADNTTDRVGRLKEVGASYIVLESLDNATQMMCDLYSIKFVTILQAATPQLIVENALQNQALSLG